MKKTLTALLFVCLAVVLAYGGASYWVGGQARKQHDLLIEQINRSNYLDVSSKSYERGLFSSKALITVTLSQPESGDSIKFSIISYIHHGPFVFLQSPHIKGSLHSVLAVIRTRLVPEGCADPLKKMLEKIPELESSEILTVISTDGSGESYFDVPAFRKTLSNDKGEQFEAEWGGFTANSKFDAPLGEVSGSYSAPSLQMTEKNQLLRIKDIQGDFNSHPGIKGISVGSASLSIGNIEGTGKENASFKLISLGLQAESGVSGQTINGSLRLGFDRLDIDGLGLGPLAMEFEMRNLDAEVLSRFQNLVPELRKKAAGQAEAANEAMETRFTEILLDLLAKSPEFEIKQLRINTDRGDLIGRARLVFAGPGKNLAGNILALLSSIDANAELSVSEALFFLVAENALRDSSAPDPEAAVKKSASELVKGLTAAKYMISEDGSFKSSATFKHGTLTVNGRKLDLSKLP
ncbi:MAG: YdgA family protein [Syntrophobacteraceae bacterium]|jgi:uncharacterized protein YdgA (DUF945 family)